MECSVCLEPYDALLRVPKMLLPCGHSLCVGCLRGVQAAAWGGSRQLCCPHCGQEVEGRDVNQFPTNYALLSSEVPRPRTRYWCVTCGAEAMPACEESEPAHDTRGLRGYRWQQAEPQLEALAGLAALQDDAAATRRTLQDTAAAEQQAAFEQRDAELQRELQACQSALQSGAEPWAQVLANAEDLLLRHNTDIQQELGVLRPAASAATAVDIRMGDLRAELQPQECATLNLALCVLLRNGQLHRQEQEQQQEQAQQIPRPEEESRVLRWPSAAELLGLLRRSACTLEVVEVAMVSRSQLVALQRLPRLRRLEVTGCLPDVRCNPQLPGPWRARELVKLRLDWLPLDTARCVLQAHGHSLLRLELALLEDPYPVLADLLRHSSVLLRQLRSLHYECRDEELCAARQSALQTQLGGCSIICRKHKVPAIIAKWVRGDNVGPRGSVRSTRASIAPYVPPTSNTEK